ncbi:MAG: hypothetical protein JXB50_06895, partial [Spirochaetes bacterium]|nr:hypothetical protein [Spirochaetota bacterium]
IPHAPFEKGGVGEEEDFEKGGEDAASPLSQRGSKGIKWVIIASVDTLGFNRLNIYCMPWISVISLYISGEYLK